MLQLPVSIQAVRRQLLLFLACTLVLSAGTLPTHAQSASEPAVPATEIWASGDTAERNAMLRRIFAAVVIEPVGAGRKVDPVTRVKIEPAW